MSAYPNMPTPGAPQGDLPRASHLHKRRFRSPIVRFLLVMSLIAISVPCRNLWAQVSAAVPAFEVVSVKSARSGTGGMDITSDPGRLTLRNVTLRFCIEAAYHLKDYQVSGGPGWINTEAYDIDAKAPGPATSGEMYRMLQPMLADRFKLALHWESRDAQGYGLLVGKNGVRVRQVESGEGAEMRVGRDHITARRVPMARFSEALSNILDRPVVDVTGLSGVFDIELKWLPDERQAVQKPGVVTIPSAPSDDVSSPSIFGAVQEQLGLKLEARKIPEKILVVVSAERPTAN